MRLIFYRGRRWKLHLFWWRGLFEVALGLGGFGIELNNHAYFERRVAPPYFLFKNRHPGC